MALQSITHGLPFPPYPMNASAAPTLTTTTYVIDAAAEKVAIVVAASTAKDIHKVHVRTGTVTTGDTVDVRIETVDSATTGDPTGTLWQTNTNGALVIADGDDSVWKSVTLTADATSLVIGDVYAVVIVNGGAG